MGFIYGVLSMSVKGFIINLIGIPIMAFLVAGAVAILYNWLAMKMGGYRLTLHEYQHAVRRHKA